MAWMMGMESFIFFNSHEENDKVINYQSLLDNELETWSSKGDKIPICQTG